jgi:hypothetical protein
MPSRAPTPAQQQQPPPGQTGHKGSQMCAQSSLLTCFGNTGGGRGADNSRQHSQTDSQVGTPRQARQRTQIEKAEAGIIISQSHSASCLAQSSPTCQYLCPITGVVSHTSAPSTSTQYLHQRDEPPPGLSQLSDPASCRRPVAAASAAVVSSHSPSTHQYLRTQSSTTPHHTAAAMG